MAGNAYNHGVQQPMFAPVSQGQGQMLGDDIDLNEIFADYFINEFEDPLNAYTNSMANYNGAAAAVALAQKQQQVDLSMNMEGYTGPAPSTLPPAPVFSPPALPTGGIKTAFHTGVAAPPQTFTPANGSMPPAKKMKPAHQPSGIVTAFHHSQIPVPVPRAGAQVVGRGGLSGRLGFSMVGGQLAHPRQQETQAPQYPQGPLVPAAQQAPASSGMSLPVGVGIRLGGIGGVAPAMAQAAPRGGHYTMWTGATNMETGGVMSEHAIAERRQRNREHAKRSRVRKKFMLESMQEQVRALQKENVELRMVIQEKIPAHAQQIISECCSKNSLFSDPNETEDADNAMSSLEKADFSLIESLTSGQQNFVLSDPRLPDNPVVYASPGFYVLTGYTQDQVLGRNCRFLQGPGTDPRSVDIIRKAVAGGSDATTCILNYKADGTPFWNQFFVAALRDADNCIVNYVGVQCEIESEAATSNLEDKVNSVLPLLNKEGEEEDDDE